MRALWVSDTAMRIGQRAYLSITDLRLGIRDPYKLSDDSRIDDEKGKKIAPAQVNVVPLIERSFQLKI
jgi:hypothetical protein